MYIDIFNDSYLDKVRKVSFSWKHASPIISMVIISEIVIHKWSCVHKEQLCDFCNPTNYMEKKIKKIISI